MLRQLVVYCPVTHTSELKSALYESGAGKIGDYENCSFSFVGKGTYKALDGAKPFSGKVGVTHTEKEERIEVVFPKYKESVVLSAMQTHPYEEVAYQIFRLENNIFKMEETDLLGTLSGSNLEEEYFFNETIDLSLSNFFSTSVPTFSLNLQMFKKIFEDDDSPDMTNPGTYEYTFVFLPESDSGLKYCLYVRNDKEQSIKIPLNKNPVRFSTDEFNYENNIVNMIKGMYTIT